MSTPPFVVRAGRALLISVVMLATALGAAELGLRGLYAYVAWSTERSPLIYERVYWAVPPWVASQSLLYDDPELGLWAQPNTTRTYVNLFGPIGDLGDVGALFNGLFPRLPAWALKRPVWSLTTNARGLRGPDFANQKAAGTFRIVVLGDSWTVGVNVDAEAAYATQLVRLLGPDAAPGKVEVDNFGVVGGRIETGRRLLPRILGLQPDLVIVAYAQNDELEARDTRPRLRSAWPVATGPPPFRLSAALRQLELYKLYRWWSAPGEDRIEATLRQELSRPSAVPMNAPGRPCPNPDVVSSRYSETLDQVVRTLADAHVPTLLLYNSVPDFSSHCTLQAMTAVASARGVPLVDSSDVLEKLQERSEADVERRLGLEPGSNSTAEPAGVSVVFRVDMNEEGSGRPPYVMGNHSSLGDFEPNLVPLFDDGTQGDQRAGDGIWSRAITFRDPQILTYAFTDGSEAGAWTGLENYRLRAFGLDRADLGHTIHLPVAKFGRHTLRSDPSHPDEIGHVAIARAVADAVRATRAFASFVAAARGDAAPPAAGAGTSAQGVGAPAAGGIPQR